MNTDIRIKTSFFRNLKTKKLEKKAGPEGIISLLKLWLYVAEYKSDGLLDLTEEDILLICETDNKDFVSILVELKFIDVDENGYKIHDWEEHNGYCASHKIRSKKAKENVMKRWSPKDEDNKNTTVIPKSYDGNTTVIPPYKNSNTKTIPPYYDGNTPSPIPYPYPYPNPNPSPDVCIKDTPTSNQKTLLINQKEKIPKAIIRTGETTVKREIDKIMSNILKKQGEQNAIM
jgi:hypothetical protein